jgi:AraC-like DNA-binding protein
VFDICEELRFYDQAHLIREFRKMYGVTRWHICRS